MIIGLTVLIALATGLVVSRTAGAWIADPAQTAVFERSGAAARVRTVVTGIVIAAVAAWFLPVDTVLSGAAGRAEAAHQWAAAGAVPAVSESVDHLAAALILGSVAGATPFLIRVDVLVHRLPDRLVYPLIGICFAAAALASFLGSSLVWSSALIIGTVATLAFAAIHLLGRVLGARTMGLGDVKLAFIVFSTSALYHPWAAAVVLVVMMVIAGVWALIGAVRARRLHGVNIAFGPAMLSGMWLGSVLARFVL
jgi:leader peptidase (prepilin peptidase)/N-methyltransferase